MSEIHDTVLRGESEKFLICEECAKDRPAWELEGVTPKPMAGVSECFTCRTFTGSGLYVRDPSRCGYDPKSQMAELCTNLGALTEGFHQNMHRGVQMGTQRIEQGQRGEVLQAFVNLLFPKELFDDWENAQSKVLASLGIFCDILETTMTTVWVLGKNMPSEAFRQTMSDMTAQQLPDGFMKGFFSLQAADYDQHDMLMVLEKALDQVKEEARLKKEAEDDGDS